MLAVILPLYKIYTAIKKLVGRFFALDKSRHPLIHTFSRRFLTHIIIIMISIFTVTINLNANEINRENFGQTSIMATLITTEELGTIEQEGPITEGKKITRYLGQASIENIPQTSEGAVTEEILPTTVAGGALVQPILSPVEEGLRQRDKIVYYTVQPGDTISEIAENFGITTNTILWENNLTSYSVVRPGDKLAILPTSGVEHKVASGETVASIAKKYDVAPEKIIDANLLGSADDIKIGENLIIPGGKKVAPAPTYVVRTITQPSVSAPIAPKVVATGNMIWPTECRRISQYYGYRHTGADIACGFGKEIYAADDGTVTKAQAGWNGGYGTMITIDHGNGKQSLYGHLSTLFVKAGETVTQGQNIGLMGSTGRSTGPHLHFEVRSGGVRQNPLYYIQ